MAAPVLGTTIAPVIRELAGAFQTAPAPNSTSVVRIQTGRTLSMVVLELTKAAAAIPTRAEMEAGILAVRVVVSGTEIWSLTGLQLIALQAYYSQIDTTADGRIILNFSRLWMRELGEILGPQLGTADQTTLDIEIDWAGGSLITTGRAYGVFDRAPEPAGTIIKMSRVTANVSAVGLYQFPDLPLPKGGDFLYALHLFVPVIANLTRVAYVADDVRLFDGPPGLMNKLAQEANPPRTPQTSKNVFTLDFMWRGFGADSVDLANVSAHMLELTFATAAPGLVPIVAEIASPISGGGR